MGRGQRRRRPPGGRGRGRARGRLLLVGHRRLDRREQGGRRAGGKYNHANVLALSLRSTSPPMGREILEAFLGEPDGAEDFDVRNVALLERLEDDP